jgi:hypothetical protein
MAPRLPVSSFDTLLRDLDEFAAVLIEDAALMVTVATMRVTASGAAYVVQAVVPSEIGLTELASAASLSLAPTLGGGSLGGLAMPPPQVSGFTRSYAAAASSPSAPTSVAVVVSTSPRLALARSKTGFARCPLEDYPDIASIERFVSLAPPSTELWVEHRLAAWDCAKFPDLIQARLDLMASAATIAEFLASRLASEPDVDHSVMLVQGLRRGTLCVRPAVARLHRAPRTVPALPWVASVTAPVFAASGVAALVAPARHRGRQHAHKSASGHRPPAPGPTM